MNANAYGLTKTISEDERQAFRKALELHYGQGMRMNDAFDQVEPGLMDRYYQRRKKYPEEIEAINREARAAAMRELSGDQLAFESRQIRESRRIQRAAIEMMDVALSALERIAAVPGLAFPDQPSDVEGSDERSAVLVLLPLSAHL